MSVYFIIFFLSLLGLGWLFGEKIRNVRKNGLSLPEDSDLDLAHLASDVERAKNLLRAGAKRIAYRSALGGMRFVLRAKNLLVTGARDIWIETKDELGKLAGRIYARIKTSEEAENAGKGAGERPVSSHLKIISDYREKIRRMKHRIKEEEGIE